MEKNLIKTLGIIVMSMVFNFADAYSEDRMIMKSATVEAGSTATLLLDLVNDTPFYGFQADINLPNGLEAVIENGIPNISMTDRFDNTFDLISNVLENGTIRLGAFSAEHHAISGIDGNIISIKVKADETFRGGKVTINNILCITEEDKDIKLLNCSSEIDCIVNVAGIELNQTVAELKVGEKLSLTASVLPVDATDKSVTWTSSDENVATVDDDGNVTAVGLGNGVISKFYFLNFRES